MRRSRHTDEEIAVLLSEAERGVPVEEICRAAHVSLRTFYRWKKRLGCLTPAALRRLRELEEENRALRKLLSQEPRSPLRPAPKPEHTVRGLVRGDAKPSASTRVAGGYRTCRLS
jgi:putative transposase